MPIGLAGGFFTLPAADIVIPSGNYAAADPAPVEFTTVGAQALTVVLDVTAQTGAGNTITLQVEGFDPASGQWIQLSSPLYAGGAAKTIPFLIDPDGPSPVKRLALANPGAGADFTQNIPTLEAWELIAADFTFTANATVANRLVGLALMAENGAELATVYYPTAVTASQVIRFSFMAGYSGAPAVTAALASGAFRVNAGVPFSGHPLQAGMQIKSLIDGIQAGDQISTLTLTIAQHIRDLFPRMRIKPVKSGTTTTLNYSVGCILSF
jgi:hypothetical protein